jgi:PAS domain S-box-containing protein/putative nucleotidyltransferase with HDIG domain
MIRKHDVDLDQVIASSPLIVFWGEPLEHRPVDFVTTNVRQFGYTVPEMVLEEILYISVVFPEDRERVLHDFRDALERGCDSFSADYRIVTRSGEVRWVEDRVIFHRNESGAAILYQSNLLDITDRKNSEMRLREDEKHLALMYEVSLALMKELDMRILIRRILEKATELAGSTNGLISVLEEDGVTLRNEWGTGVYTSLVGMKNPSESGFFGDVLSENRRTVVEDYRVYSKRYNIPAYKDVTTVVGMPLYRGERRLGVLAIAFTHTARTFEESSLRLLDQFAASASIALENARLYEASQKELKERTIIEDNLRFQQLLVEDGYKKLRKTFEEVIHTMGQVVGKKDPYTIRHQERVARLACGICGKMGLDEQKCKGASIAGLVHDVGKIEVPGEILSKPGRLTSVEFELIKTHARSSFDILREIDFPWPVAEIAHQHHERMDGSGYPRGLKGGDILLEARILGVADVVESMSSHRPYRPSLGIKAAMEEIEKNRGALYDPEVVDACLALLEEKPEIIAE